MHGYQRRTIEHFLEQVVRLAIVIPVFNDWDSLAALMRELGQQDLQGWSATVVIVDDASTADAAKKEIPNDLPSHCVQLAVNLGHQRAIAIGLHYVSQNLDPDAVIVMDADGEDRASDVPRLLKAHTESPNSIVCAHRTRRSESVIFRFGYWLYRALFRTLCGLEIAFGNFCLIPRNYIKHIIYHHGAWNHLAATILRSRAPIEALATIRGSRFFGVSKLSLMGLVLHGLSAIAAFGDIVIGRLAVLAAGAMAVSILFGILVTVGRLTTQAFIPGFATTLILFVFSLSLQVLFFCLVAILILLNNRSTATFIVARDADAFIASVIEPLRND